MTAEIPKPAEIRKTNGYLWRRILAKWPVLVWIGMLVLTLSLHKRGTRFERMNGFVIAQSEVISALDDGVILNMSVSQTGESVEAGQLVVNMDPRIIEAERDEKSQELEFERIDQQRKFGTLKNDYETQIQKLKAERDGAQAQLEILQASLPDLQARAEAKTIKMSMFTEKKAEADTLRASLPYYGQTVEGLEAAVKKIDDLLNKLKAFNEQEPVIIKSLNDQIERMKLTSVSGGSVSQLFFRTGSVVKRGEPIVKIIDMNSLAVRGFIQEENAQNVSVDMEIFISPTGESAAAIYPGKITYIAPQISSTPDIGSSVSGRVIKGREITCSFEDSDIKLLPGQSVTIHLEKPGKLKMFDFLSK